VFGHLFTLLTTPLPDDKASLIIKQYSNLVDLCQCIDREFFAHSSGGSSESNFERL